MNKICKPRKMCRTQCLSCQEFYLARFAAMSADWVGLGFFIGQTCALDSTFCTHPGMFLCLARILCISYLLVLIVSFFCLTPTSYNINYWLIKVLLKIWTRFEITSDELEYTRDPYYLWIYLLFPIEVMLRGRTKDNKSTKYVAIFLSFEYYVSASETNPFFREFYIILKFYFP